MISLKRKSVLKHEVLQNAWPKTFVIPLITYILRRSKLYGKYEYDTDMKANKGYTDLGEVSKKLVALENLNEHGYHICDSHLDLGGF